MVMVWILMGLALFILKEELVGDGLVSRVIVGNG